MKKLWALLLILVLASGGVFYLQREWQVAGGSDAGLVEIPEGMGVRGVVGLLEGKKVIRNGNAALAYVVYTGARHKLQAGEYMFDRALTIPQVIDKLVTGAVYLRRFTVPEGLTLATIANKWQEDGFGKSDEFVKAAEAALHLVHRFDDKATSVEGYLFPETYSFPRRTTAQQAVDAMISRFGFMLARLQREMPPENWPLNVRETVILASLVETEAAHADERPLVASVYVNRLKRRMLLQCDPTVIYGLLRENQYRGRLTLTDLRHKSPYNTYVHPGLPPGPIANPGYASLLAAVQPATSKYLFFVRTVEARHTFSETLSAHNRAVAAYRKLRRAS
jgi:UPF0755 protein